MAVRIFRRFRIFVFGFRFRIVRIRALALRRRYVHDLACQDIRFGHNVFRFECFGVSGLHGFNNPLVAGLVIRYDNVRQRQVAVIRHSNLVGDRLAQCVGLTVRRCGSRFLFHRQMAVRFYGLHRRDGFLLKLLITRLVNGSCHRVGKAAGQDIRFGDNVRCCCLNRRSAGYVFKHALCQLDTIDFAQCNRPCVFIDVGRGDREGHFLTQLVRSLVRGLGHNQIVIHGLLVFTCSVRYRQRTFYLCNRVVAGLCTCLQRVGEGILAAADQRLASGHIVCRAFAVREAVTADGYRVIRQCGSVIHLLVRCAFQRYSPLRDLQLAVLDHKLDIREVLADVCEVFSLQLHVIGADVCALHGIIAAELKVSFGVQRVTDTGY